MKYLANHQLIELYECNVDILNDNERVIDILVEAADVGKANVIEQIFHQFSPHGLTGVLVIAESHISIHTWPKLSYAAVDIFSCDDKVLHDAIYIFLQKQLGAKRSSSMSVNRGLNNN